MVRERLQASNLIHPLWLPVWILHLVPVTPALHENSSLLSISGLRSVVPRMPCWIPGRSLKSNLLLGEYSPGP